MAAASTLRGEATSALGKYGINIGWDAQESFCICRMTPKLGVDVTNA